MDRSPADDSSLSAIALWILDLGVLPEEARQWAMADPEHPVASCLELIEVMEALAS